LRIGGLAVLWVPTVLLITAELAPARAWELNLIALLTLGFGILTDRLLPWPRGPSLPALVGLASYGAALLLGSDIIVRSLLGPNPRFGSRYFGIGNELGSALPVLLFAALAVLLARWPRGGKSAAVFAISGLATAILIGSGRFGSDVGGFLMLIIGVTVATLLMLPRLTKGPILIGCLTVIGALGGLAVLDTLTGGNGHFMRSVVGATQISDLWDIVTRRYALAFQQLQRGLMPLLTLIAIGLTVYGVKKRQKLYGPLGNVPSWRAALIGGTVTGYAGALVNDSGPILLVITMGGLLFLTAYVRGNPQLAASSKEGLEVSRV